MFELAFEYDEIFNKAMQHDFYCSYGFKNRRRDMLLLLVEWIFLFLGYGCFMLGKANYLTIRIIFFTLTILLCYLSKVLIWNWECHRLNIETRLIYSKFKETSKLQVKITQQEVLMDCGSKMYRLISDYSIKELKNDGRIVYKCYIIETEKYIYFTISKCCYLVYIDKSKYSDVDIKNIVKWLKSIFKHNYIKATR